MAKYSNVKLERMRNAQGQAKLYISKIFPLSVKMVVSVKDKPKDQSKSMLFLLIMFFYFPCFCQGFQIFRIFFAEFRIFDYDVINSVFSRNYKIRKNPSFAGP